MLLEIKIYANPVLRQKGKKIEKITPEIKELAKNMLETMYAANGIGLAAQQIGETLQIAVIDIKDAGEDRPSKMWIKDKEVNPKDYMPLVLINPELKLTKKKVDSYEGCLSLPGLTGDLTRSYRVSVKALDIDGKVLEFDAADLLGRCIQHEVDHLNGILYIDHMDKAERKRLDPYIKELKETGKIAVLPPEPETEDDHDHDDHCGCGHSH